MPAVMRPMTRKDHGRIILARPTSLAESRVALRALRAERRGVPYDLRVASDAVSPALCAGPAAAPCAGFAAPRAVQSQSEAARR